MYKLSQREEGYSLDIFKGLSETDAYKNNYSATKMSFNVIRVEACRVRARPRVSERIDELRDEVKKEIVSKVISDETERREILTDIERGKVSDYVDDKGNLDSSKIKELDSSSVREIKTVEWFGKDEQHSITTTLRLNNPIPAITEHNKMDKVYEDKPAIVVPIQIIVGSEKSKELVEALTGGKRQLKEGE